VAGLSGSGTSRSCVCGGGGGTAPLMGGARRSAA
jgi:hypothetical protein